MSNFFDNEGGTNRMSSYELKPKIIDYDVSTPIAQQKVVRHILSKISIYNDANGSKVYFLVDNNTNIAKKVSEEYLIDTVAQELDKSSIILSERTIKEQVRTWAMTAKKLDKFPPSFSTSPDEITFLRLNLNEMLNSEQETPTWDSFLDRCGSNATALMAFTWSLLESPENYHDQYLFLKGPGGDGKGSYIRFLCKLFDNNAGAHAAFAALSTEDDRWVAQCVGKRLGTFNDINNTSIVMTTAFKNVTGRDPVTINQKYEKSYSTTLDTKFVLTTNKMISIGGDASEKRRAIIINMQPVSRIIPGYEDKLWAEAGGFLYKCKQAFYELYDKEAKIIKCDYKDFANEKDDFEEFSIYLLEKYFEVKQGAELSAMLFYETIRDELRGKYDIKDFKQYLSREYGVNRYQKNSDGRRYYKGIKLKGRREHNTNNKAVELLKNHD